MMGRLGGSLKRHVVDDRDATVGELHREMEKLGTSRRRVDVQRRRAIRRLLEEMGER